MINIRGRISYAFRCKNCILLSTLIFSKDLQQRDLVRTPESGLTSGDFSCISPNLSFYTLQHEHVLRQYNMMLFILVRVPAIRKMVIGGRRVAKISFIPSGRGPHWKLETNVWSILCLAKVLKFTDV